MKNLQKLMQILFFGLLLTSGLYAAEVHKVVIQVSTDDARTQ